MEFLGGLLIFLAILIGYLILVSILAKKGILKRHNISLAGPMLMFRTKRGLNLLDRLAKPTRFWKIFGSISVVLCFILMIGLVVFMIVSIPAYSQISPEAAPTPQMILVIPGINPLLPLEYLVYVIIALAAGVVIHEFSHGILLRAQQMKVKSLGLLYMIVPLGAFTEEDEEELKSVEKRKRLRVLAVGPTSNFVLALVCMILFSVVMLGNVTPVAEGVVIANVEGEFEGIKEGMIITAINNQKIDGVDTYVKVAEKLPKGEPARLSLYEKGKGSSVANFVFRGTPSDTSKEEGKYPHPLPFDHKRYLETLSNPFQPRTFAIYFSLPLLRFQGEVAFPSELKAAYLTPFNEGVFWFIEDLLYWTFWLNLLIGLTNILPIAALDGGQMFNDAVDEVLKRLRIKEASRKKMVSAIGMSFTLILLIVLIAVPLIVPRI